MKTIFWLVVCLWGGTLFAQPVSDEHIKLRLENLEKAIRRNPFNDSLIWERIELSISGFPTLHEVLHFEFTETRKKNALETNQKYSADIERLEKNLIAKKKFDIVEEGDFYLHRLWFHFHCLEFEKAIADAIHLRDSASYSKYDGRGEYYHNWANFALFNLYILNQDYPNALKTIDNILALEREFEPKQYYSYFSGSQGLKILILEHFKKENELLNYLQVSCLDNFDKYFELRTYKDHDFKNSLWLNDYEYYSSRDNYNFETENYRQKGLYFLQSLVEYQEKYKHPDMERYRAIFNELSVQVNENHFKVKPELSDEEIKRILYRML
ncbi:MAG: hypothetical protein ACK479_16585 [Fluviicola sp.]